jgi:hypothetical protein
MQRLLITTCSTAAASAAFTCFIPPGPIMALGLGEQHIPSVVSGLGL